LLNAFKSHHDAVEKAGKWKILPTSWPVENTDNSYYILGLSDENLEIFVAKFGSDPEWKNTRVAFTGHWSKVWTILW